MDFSKLTDQEVINVLDVSCALQNKIMGELNKAEIECMGDLLSDIIDRTNELYKECWKRNINLNN